MLTIDKVIDMSWCTSFWTQCTLQMKNNNEYKSLLTTRLEGIFPDTVYVSK